MKKVLILYTEYAPYLHACINRFTQLFGYEVHIVRYPIDKNAPFTFSDTLAIKFHERKELDRKGIYELYKKLDPVCVLVAGWIDKDYNAILPQIKKEGKLVIAVLDNQWTGSFKQRLFTRIGKFFIKKRYTDIWVPGIFQYEYMCRSGIPGKMVMTGYYCADSELFLPKYRKLSQMPKKFIYVGRLLDIKGTPTLLKAIEMLNAKGPVDWEFLIIGSGTYENQVKELSKKYPNVIYKPFMQPEDLARETAGGGVFVLPSNYDAWGAVVHEYAMLGFPLILSSMVGSRNYFVTPGYNGYIFESANPDSLVSVFERVMNLNEASLLNMSERSHEIGRTLNTESWASRLNDKIHSHYNN